MHSMVKSVAKLLARGPHRQSSPRHLPHSAFLSFVILFYIFISLILPFVNQLRRVTSTTTTTVKQPPFYQTKQTHSSPIGGHPYPWCANPIFFARSMIDLYTIVCLVQLPVTSPCPSPPYMHVHIRPRDCT